MVPDEFWSRWWFQIRYLKKSIFDFDEGDILDKESINAPSLGISQRRYQDYFDAQGVPDEFWSRWWTKIRYLRKSIFDSDEGDILDKESINAPSLGISQRRYQDYFDAQGVPDEFW